MSIVVALEALKKYISKKNNVKISNSIFGMHRFTCAFLLCCSAMTTFKQIFGSNIHCMLGYSDVPMPMFESYCFMQSTYTLPHPINYSSIQHHHHAQPGVSAGEYGTSRSEKGTKYHNYYQWVCLVLVLQACVCYVPWVLWKKIEHGRVERLVEKISKDPLTEVPLADQMAGLATFMDSHSGWYNSCAFCLLAFQSLCVLLTVGQLFLMDLMLGHQFLQLGSLILTLDQIGRGLEKVFPLVVMCDMTYMGPTGEPTMVSGMCTLPINIINEKIYVVLWLLYIAIITISGIILLGQLTLATRYLRHMKLQRSCPSVPGILLRRLVNKYTYGDFVLMQLLANNLDSTQFEVFISILSETENHVINPSPVTSSIGQ